jgi:hypothetical protein
LSMKKKKKSAPPNGDSGDKVKNNWCLDLSDYFFVKSLHFFIIQCIP